MNTAAIYHRPLDNWCYPLDSDHLHLRLQTASHDVDDVRLVTGDPFDWKDGRWVTAQLPLSPCGNDGIHQFWDVVVTPRWRRCKYLFVLRSGSETWEYGERGLLPAHAVDAEEQHRNAFNFPAINAADLFRAPSWVHSTVWYQVFPERFANGDPALNPEGTRAWHRGPVTNRETYGGDLRGLRARLDHLAELGCNGLYLTPIFQSPSVHKYDTTDYLKIDPAFGTEDDLRALVKSCHQRGIRVLLDAVFNHAGAGFAPWQDVLRHGAASRYADWFHIHDFERLAPRPSSAHRDLGYATFAFAANMPKLNTAHPAVREYLLQATEYWMQFGIDGWRLDVSNEVDHDFWRAYRRTVKALNPEAYLVGEVWHDAMKWLRGDQYDAVMNYRYGNAVSDFVLGRNRMTSAREFAQTVDGIDASYPLPVLRAAFNVLDSHDTDRFLTRCGGNKAQARLGWLLLFVLRGSPCIYYGSEVGLEGGQDPDNRRCMEWDHSHQDREQFAFFQRLVQLRIDRAELINHGARQWVVGEHPDVLTLRLSLGDQRLTVRLNRGAQPAAGLQAWGYEIA